MFQNRKILRARRIKKRKKNDKGGESYDMMRIPYATIQPTFDYYLVNEYFPAVDSTSRVDDRLKEVIEKRLKDIVPRSEEITHLTQTISKLMVILDRLKVSPEHIDACKILDFHVVGSLRMGTLLKGHRIADLTVVLKTLPVKAAISALGNKILEELQRIEPISPYQISFRGDYLELSNCLNRDIIRVLVATSVQNVHRLDREIHVRKNSVVKHLKAISHVKWFEENVKSNDVKNLIRIMKDLCSRFKEFSFFSPWMIIILCHYSLTQTRNQVRLPLHIAFKRILQILSSGIFLPYSAGITDPCEPKMPIHGKLSVYDQETITRRAQSLLRALNYPDGFKFMFGLEMMNANEAELGYWDEIIKISTSVFDNKDKQQQQQQDNNDGAGSSENPSVGDPNTNTADDDGSN